MCGCAKVELVDLPLSSVSLPFLSPLLLCAGTLQKQIGANRHSMTEGYQTEQQHTKSQIEGLKQEMRRKGERVILIGGKGFGCLKKKKRWTEGKERSRD